MQEPLPTLAVPPADWSQVPAPPPLPATSFGMGALIGRTLSVWARCLHLNAAVALLAHAPVAVAIYLLYAQLAAVRPETPALWFVGMGGFSVLSMALGVAEMGAVAHGAVQRLRGARPSLAGMLAAGFRRWPAVLGLALLVGLAVIAIYVPVMAAAGYLATAATRSGSKLEPFLTASLSVLVAFLVCTVPVLLLATAWSAALPAAAVERAGPIRALSRSWGLTRGYRWQVFGGFAVLGLVVFFASYLVQIALMLPALLAFRPQAMDPGADPSRMVAVTMAVMQIVWGLAGTVFLTASGVTYHGTRTAKEGDDPDRLARVFE